MSPNPFGYSEKTMRRLLAVVAQLEEEGTPATAPQIGQDLPDLAPGSIRCIAYGLCRNGLLQPGSRNRWNPEGYRLTDAGRRVLEGS